jgi:hypothetical protein
MAAESINTLQRATRIFRLDEREPGCPFVEKIWRTRSAPYEGFISVAASHWEIVVWHAGGQTHVTVRGPETRAKAVPIPADAEFFGIQFRLGVFMPALPVAQLVDRDLTLTCGVGNCVRLDGSSWDIPSYDNADVFVGRLARLGLITKDPIVEAVLHGRPVDLTQRTLERRMRRATGLTLGTIKQIERASLAADLLDRGGTILDAVARAGYADQPHLTRWLKRFIGQTPAQIAANSA